MVSSMEVEAGCMLYVGHLTDEVEVMIHDSVGDGGLAGCVKSSAQVL